MKSLTRKLGQNKTAIKQLSIKNIDLLTTLTATVRLCHISVTCQTFVTCTSKLYYCIPCDTEIVDVQWILYCKKEK